MKRIPPNPIRVLAVVLLAGTVLGGCMGRSETGGTIVGGIGGAVLGNQIGGGTGKTIATALGAIIGAAAGGQIGRMMDARSQEQAGRATHRALDTGTIGEPIAWENPDNRGGPARGSAKVTRQGRNADGEVCREFQQTVTIGTREEQSYGTACRDAAGDWRIVS